MTIHTPTEKAQIEDVRSELSEKELSKVSDAMISRYIRKEKGSTSTALTSLRSTLQWRAAFNISSIVRLEEPFKSSIRSECSGKVYVRGMDKEGRAVMYMKPRLENTRTHDANLQHVVFNLEKACACSSTCGKEGVNLIMDFNGYKLRDAPPMKTSRSFLTVLQSHYPERLHRAYIVNPPMIFRAFWTVVKPFIDPHTKRKIVFVKGDKEVEDKIISPETGIDRSELEDWVGGDRVNATVDGNFDKDFYLGLPIDVDYGYGREGKN